MSTPVRIMDASMERRLIKAAEEVTTRVAGGASPEDALVKVANALDLNPAQMCRAGEAYNTACSIRNQRTKSGHDRLGNIPLVNIDNAIATAFPSGVKSAAVTTAIEQAAVSTPVPNLMAKAAAAAWKHPSTDFVFDTQIEPSAPLAGSTYNRQASIKRANEIREENEVRDALAGANNNLTTTLIKAADDLRYAFPRLPFSYVEEALHARYDKALATQVADTVWEASMAEKMGQSRYSGQPTRRLHDYSLTPFTTIDRFVKAALDVVAAETRFNDYQTKAASANSSVEEEGRNGPFAFRFAQRAKQANIANIRNTLFGMTGVPDRLNTSSNPSGAYERELQSAIDGMEDPDTRDQITRIKTQTIVSELLKNDPVLSRYDQSEVIDRFNELAEVAPQIIDKPMMLRSALRRVVQAGGVDPFEVGQYASISNQFKEQATPDRELLAAMTGDAAGSRVDVNRLQGERQRDAATARQHAIQNSQNDRLFNFQRQQAGVQNTHNTAALQTQREQNAASNQHNSNVLGQQRHQGALSNLHNSNTLDETIRNNNRPPPVNDRPEPLEYDDNVI